MKKIAILARLAFDFLCEASQKRESYKHYRRVALQSCKLHRPNTSRKTQKRRTSLHQTGQNTFLKFNSSQPAQAHSKLNSLSTLLSLPSRLNPIRPHAIPLLTQQENCCIRLRKIPPFSTQSVDPPYLSWESPRGGIFPKISKILTFHFRVFRNIGNTEIDSKTIFFTQKMLLGPDYPAVKVSCG